MLQTCMRFVQHKQAIKVLDIVTCVNAVVQGIPVRIVVRMGADLVSPVRICDRLSCGNHGVRVHASGLMRRVLYEYIVMEIALADV